MSQQCVRKVASPDRMVAIVGIGCRLPGGVSNPSELKEFLDRGGDACVAVPPDRWSTERFFNVDPAVPGRAYVRHGGFVSQSPFDFDPEPFGISPREADRLDPQQRWLLEVTLEAFEDALIPIDSMQATRTAVYVGGFTQDHQNQAFTEENRHLIDAHTSVGASMTVLSNRISHTFDLRGPSVTVDTACSGSLVAVHLACQAILHEACDVAIAGGVNVMLSPMTTIAMCKGNFLSPDGRSKAFDARADGYGRAEGAAVVLLKRLDLALRDHNPIYAVIHGSGLGQDGRTDGMPMPSMEAQKSLIESVIERSGIDRHAIGYVEAHGTGTRVGDPTEATAVGLAYGRGRAGLLHVGSVKSNLGHLEACAGVTGLIKAALAIKHRRIIPQRMSSEANPEIPFERLGLQIATSSEPWPGDGPAMAAVNSFGYGGTNAHVILGEPPPSEHETRSALRIDSGEVQGPICVPISTAGKASIRQFASHLALALDDQRWLAQVRTLACHRTHYSERAVIIAANPNELRASLSTVAQGTADERTVQGRSQPDRQLLWLFTGMGPQWWAMGQELYAANRVFRGALDEVDGYFRGVAHHSLLELMLSDQASSRMRANEVAQPSNFALQVGLVSVLRSLGVPSHGMLGHSVGEVAAAWASGCLSLREATEVSYYRSQLQQRIAGCGGLLAVGADPALARRLVEEVEGVEIAAYNSPRSVAFAGSHQALESLSARLAKEGVFHRQVAVEVPYHSSYMDPLREEFLTCFASLQPRPPQIRLFSTVTGTEVVGTPFDAQYLWQNARQPVRLNDALRTAIETGMNTFVEIGPHPVLATSIGEVLDSLGKSGSVHHCLRRNLPESMTLLRTVASLHVCGVKIDWSAHTESQDCADVPHYTFTRSRHWVESSTASRRRTGFPSASGLLEYREDGPTPRYSIELASPRFSHLVDHEVGGQVVVPAAFYLAAAFEHAFAHNQCGGAVCLGACDFERVLVVPKSSSTVLLMDVDATASTARYFSKVEAGDWLHHATVGFISRDPFEATVQHKLSDLLHVHATELDVHSLYQKLERQGLRYGPAFRRLHQVFVRVDGTEDTVLARLQDQSDALGGAHLHSTTLDAAFQAVLALFDDFEQAPIPIHLDGITLWANAQGVQWVYATARLTNDGTISADIELLDANGTTICRVRGLQCRAVASASEIDSASERLYYRDGWITLKARTTDIGDTGGVLVVGDASVLSMRLVATLTRRGARCRVAQPSELAADPVVMSRFDQVLFVSEPQATDPTGVLRCEALAEITNNLQSEHTNLVIVTVGARNVVPGERPDPAQAALWGFGRVVMTERPELNCRLIDLGDTAQVSVDRLGELLGDPALEEEVALRGQEIFCRRLQRLPIEHFIDPSSAGKSWRRDRTVLITGGLTGLGLETAKWLVHRGAKSIVLASRRGHPDPSAAIVVRKLQRRARIECRGVDVNDRESVASLLNDIGTNLPPLGGIFHSAMVLDDKPINALDGSSLRMVMHPKVIGALHLDELTKQLDLDFFVLYSSVSALVGNPNQSSYAAANAWLQALAEARAAAGLPATCISWGAIGDVGVVSRDMALETYLKSLGLEPIPARRALRLMDRVIASNLAHVGVIDEDWNRWTANFSRTPWHRLSELLDTDEPGNVIAELHSWLAQLSPSEFHDVLRQRIALAVAPILRIEPSTLETETKLSRLGLDSLMAAEVSRAIERTIGVVVGAIEILSNVSVDDLARVCAARIGDVESNPPPERSRVTHRQVPDASARADLREYLLSRICVQPPYFDLDELAHDGEWLTATVSPLAPTEHEWDMLSSAEVARHLAILGSCAVSLAHPASNRIYYPVRSACRPESAGRRAVLDGTNEIQASSSMAIRARCVHIDLGASRARAEAWVISANAAERQVLDIEYHLIDQGQFERMFAVQRRPTLESVLPNPYQTWRELPPIHLESEAVSVNLGPVLPEQCLGHFTGFPALPLSIMMRDAVRLVAEGIRVLTGWHRAQVTVVQGGVVTHAFAFAGQPLSVVAQRTSHTPRDLVERWQCSFCSEGAPIADVELEVQVHPNLAVSGFAGIRVRSANSA